VAGRAVEGPGVGPLVRYSLCQTRRAGGDAESEGRLMLVTLKRKGLVCRARYMSRKVERWEVTWKMDTWVGTCSKYLNLLAYLYREALFLILCTVLYVRSSSRRVTLPNALAVPSSCGSTSTEVPRVSTSSKYLCRGRTSCLVLT
jgi:hypothetical protein